MLPPTKTIGSFAIKVQTQLKTATTPRILAHPAGTAVSNSLTAEEAWQVYARPGKERLQFKVTWSYANNAKSHDNAVDDAEWRVMEARLN